MGQAAVRAAVQALVQNAQVPMVGTVYPSRPLIIDEYDYELSPEYAPVVSNAGSACVVIVNLPGPDKRVRIADTGRSAQYDMYVHPVTLELFFTSVGGGATAAQADYDTIVDVIVPLIRTNATLAAPATIWSAGEYKAGVTHIASAPFTSVDGLSIGIKGQIKFEAYEQIVGNAP